MGNPTTLSATSAEDGAPPAGTAASAPAPSWSDKDGDFLISGEERHRIEFDNKHWVEILPHVTVGMRQAWSSVANKTKTKLKTSGRGKKMKQEGESDVEFDNAVFIVAFMRDIVKAWSSPQPINDVTIAQMAESMVTRIQNEFNRLNPGDEEPEEHTCPKCGAIFVEDDEAKD